MDREIYEKMLRDADLTPGEQAELEVALSSDTQQSVSRMVSELPEESPCLAWRSALNDRLRDSGQGRPERRKLQLGMWIGAITATGATALAMMFFWPQATGQPVPVPEGNGFEELIVRSHSDSVSANGIGVLLPTDPGYEESSEGGS